MRRHLVVVVVADLDLGEPLALGAQDQLEHAGRIEAPIGDADLP